MQELWSHQKEAIERAKSVNAFGLFFEPGCGKSLTAIRILESKYTNHGRVLKTLILCPLIVVEQWAREWKKFSLVLSKHVIPLTGAGKKKAQHFCKQVATYPSSIVITNYESLYASELLNLIHHWGPQAIVIDESHRIKSHDSKRTKIVLGLSKHCHYRYILSGTPILNSLMDVFPQIQALDDGACLGSNFFAFRKNYFSDLNERRKGTHSYFPHFVPKADAAERISSKISGITMHVKKDDVLDLPPLVVKDLFVELNPEQRRIYEAMKKDFVAILNEKACTADLAITKALRLQQIANGFIRFEDGSETSFDDNPRLQALAEILEDTAPYHKTIVWCVFKRNYEQIAKICNQLKLGYTELHGDTKDKDGAVTSFNSDPNVRVLIGHPGSGGIGVNLTAANHSIFYSRTFSLEHKIQADARNYRGGSKEAGHEKITRIDIIAKDTIDELIITALKSKEALGGEVLAGGLSQGEILDLLKNNLQKL